MNTNMNDLFITATRKRYRFPYKGLISVEDLWLLGVNELDEVYKTLNKHIKNAEDPGLLDENKADEGVLNMIDIVKYIFSVKMEEGHKRELEAENAAKRKRIMEIMARKQDEVLESMSEEELKKLLDETL